MGRHRRSARAALPSLRFKHASAGSALAHANAQLCATLGTTTLVRGSIGRLGESCVDAAAAKPNHEKRFRFFARTRRWRVCRGALIAAQRRDVHSIGVLARVRHHDVFRLATRAHLSLLAIAIAVSCIGREASLEFVRERLRFVEQGFGARADVCAF